MLGTTGKMSETALTQEANSLQGTTHFVNTFRGAVLKDTGNYKNPCLFMKGGLFVAVVTYENRTEIFAVNPRHASAAWGGMVAESGPSHETLLEALRGESRKRKAKLRMLPNNSLALFIGVWNSADKEFERVSSKVVLDALPLTEAHACSIEVMWHLRALESAQQREEAETQKKMQLLKALFGSQ